MERKPSMKPCNFEVLIDTAEEHPWSFKKIVGYSRDKDQSLIVPTRFVSLGRYPNSLGDYSIEGFVGEVAIERKSREDLQGTLLGFPKKDKDGEISGTARRERFERELANLSQVRCSAVIVEATLQECCLNIDQWGTKSTTALARTIQGSVIAYQQDYLVSWFFCNSRRHAEIVAFRYLERFWKHNKKGKTSSINGRQEAL